MVFQRYRAVVVVITVVFYLRVPAERDTSKRTLLPLSLHASWMNTGISLAFVSISLVGSLRKSNVHPLKRRPAVGVLEWSAPSEAVHDMSPNVCTFRGQNENKSEDNRNKPRQRDPWPRACIMTNVIEYTYDNGFFLTLRAPPTRSVFCKYV